MLTDETASPTDARKNFFNLLERVAKDHQIIVVQRRDGENVALIAESDLSSLMETAYLLKSPRNAQRLQAALERSKARDGQPASSNKSTEQAIAQLKEELGIGKEER